MAAGKTTIDFGAFPGAPDAQVAITGQAQILATSLVEAWLKPEATADHSIDEHLIEGIRVIAGPPSVGTGFTIYAFVTNGLPDPEGWGVRLYGQWTVAWAWL